MFTLVFISIINIILTFGFILLTFGFILLTLNLTSSLQRAR